MWLDADLLDWEKMPFSQMGALPVIRGVSPSSSSSSLSDEDSVSFAWN